MPDPDDVPRTTTSVNLNPNSLEVLTGAKLEPALAGVPAGDALPVRAPRLLLRRLARLTRPARPVFNRAVALRDTWAKIEKKG